MAEAKVAAVMGVGPGLGAAVARRFARGGFAVALLARNEESMRPVAEAIAKEGGRAKSFTADATDAPQIAAAFARIRADLGAPDVFVYNAGAFHIGSVIDVSPDDFERAWKANCFGAFLAVREVVPAMVQKKTGTVLLTGATASLRGSARFSCLAVGKFGLRALAQSLARELGPSGVHVAHVVIDGAIDTPRVRAMMPGRDPSTMLAPDAIAETYWHLHGQDPTAWTFEIDLRPAAEKF
jgi:NAD(P)-dependent dehydrogenase (short-subunit alcohol dehydrogenase family)